MDALAIYVRAWQTPAMRPDVTAVDLVRNHFGELLGPVDADRLSDAQVHEFASVLAQFFRSPPRLPSPQRDQLPLYISRGNSIDVALVRVSLLYVNQVVVTDPLHAWLLESYAGPVVSGRDLRLESQSTHPDSAEWRATRTELPRALGLTRKLAPVLESGAVLTTPLVEHPWQPDDERDNEGVMAACDPDFASAVVGSAWARNPEFRPDSDGDILDYDSDAAAVGQLVVERFEQAQASQARFAPLEPLDWAYLKYRLRTDGETDTAPSMRRQRFEMRMVKALEFVDLPTFPTLDFDALASIRRDDETFAEWRAELNSVVRHLELVPSAEDFVRSATDALEDALRPRAAAVKRSSRRLETLKQSVKEEYGTVALAGASIAGLSAVGVPLKYSAITASLTASAKVAVKTIFAPTPRGTQAIVVGLSRSK